MTPRVVDPSEFVDRMLDLLRRTIGKTIEIAVVNRDDLWRCEVDAVQLEGAILNLALNARDAMPEGGTLTIDSENVSLDDPYAAAQVGVTPGPYVMIGVTGSGTGIDGETVDQVFEPFFTTKEAGQGSGLGLSMVYGFVKQSGGHVTIYSEQGEGMTAKMYLPRSRASAGGAQEPDREMEARARGETILVVEDDPELWILAILLLRDLGYGIVETSDGPSALAALDGGSPINMVLTAVVLPGGMGGPSLVKEIRRRVPGVAVLFMSGYTDNAIVHQGRLDKGVDLLDKPFRKGDFARKERTVPDKETT